MVIDMIRDIPGAPDSTIGIIVVAAILLFVGHTIWLYWIRQENSPVAALFSPVRLITRAYSRTATDAIRTIGFVLFLFLISLEGLFRLVSLSVGGDPITIIHIGGIIGAIFGLGGDLDTVLFAGVLLVAGAALGFVVSATRITTVVLDTFRR